jgi:Domain of Unknown Function (DUF1080)
MGIQLFNQSFTIMYKRFKSLVSLLSVFGLLLLLFFNSCNSSRSTQEGKNSTKVDKEGFVELFDGKTLNGWEGDMACWRVENGIVVGEVTASSTPLKNNSFLIWRNGLPSDFELKTDYRISPQGNSGIQYRSEEVKDIPYALKGYQADIDGRNQYTGQNYEERGRCIVAYRGQKVVLPPVTGSLDSIAKKNVWTASVVTGSLGNSDSLKALLKEGWNECHIIIKGNHLQHFINGVLMCDITDNDTINRKFTGLLGLQVHAGHLMKVEYRNLRLKEIK